MAEIDRTTPIQVLLVEDDEVDQLAFERFVRDGRIAYDFRIASSVAEAKALLATDEFDVLILDFNLGDGTAFDILDLGIDSPIVITTGSSDIDTAVTMMKAGAYDYLVKDLERDYLKVLPLTVEKAIRRKKADEQFRLLSHALMSTSDSVFITDLEGKIIFVNRAFSDTYGYDAREILGRPRSTIGEVEKDGELYHARKDGSEFPVSMSTSDIRDQGDNRIAIASVSRDISERKLAEEQLKRINEELDGYAHTVSHDLKGPLAAIRLANDTLQALLEKSCPKSERPEEMDEVADVINRNVEKAAAMIEGLLALAQAGQEPKEASPVDVGRVVAMVLDELAGALKEKGIDVRVDEDLGSVTADPTHIYQLFSNLLGNSVRYCPDHSGVIEVRYLGETPAGHHRYLVRDNGPGIPEENIDRVFVPFFKGDSGGSGIGLGTVAKIVEVYGGRIEARNDGGACFEFTLKDFQV